MDKVKGSYCSGYYSIHWKGRVVSRLTCWKSGLSSLRVAQHRARSAVIVEGHLSLLIFGRNGVPAGLSRPIATCRTIAICRSSKSNDGDWLFNKVLSQIKPNHRDRANNLVHCQHS